MNGIGSSRRPWGRIAIGVAAAVVVVLAGASPAAAHGGGDETGPANYRSEITDPGADGLSWQVLDGDGSVELTNTTGAEVIVVGYQGEPYLRFTPGDGVYRNTNSPATYLNEDRFGDAEIPPGTSAGAEPNWEQVDAGRTFAWHDHRAHWMSRTDPPQVAADPDRQHLIAEFQIPLLIDDGTTTRAVTAGGELRWLPDVAWWPPILILTGVFVAFVAAVAATTRPSYERWIPLARAVTAIVLVVVAANLVRTIDDLTTHTTDSERAVIVISSLVAFAAIGALCARGWRGHPGGFAALAGAAMLVMLLFGGEASGDLSAPQLVTSLPEWLRRWTIAASYTVVAPAFIAAALAGRWYSRTRPDAAPATPATVATSTAPVSTP
jgi:hypothetical protein